MCSWEVTHQGTEGSIPGLGGAYVQPRWTPSSSEVVEKSSEVVETLGSVKPRMFYLSESRDVNISLAYAVYLPRVKFVYPQAQLPTTVSTTTTVRIPTTYHAYADLTI
jgi:hypothetical protein